MSRKRGDAQGLQLVSAGIFREQPGGYGKGETGGTGGGSRGDQRGAPCHSKHCQAWQDFGFSSE